MHTYSHLAEHPLALDARIAIYSRAAANDRLTHPSVHAYSPKYVSSWRMKSGEEILFRPIRPEDEPLMVEFHKTLSEQSVYLRYRQAQNLRMRVAHERLIRRCCIDSAHETALVAVRTMPETGQDEILAVGRLSKLPFGEKAEVAVLVSDPYQRHGLGTELVRRLIQVAHDQKMQEIIANFLPENTGMRALANRFGFQFRPSSDPTVLKTVLNLTNAQGLLSLRRYAGRHWCG
jgi:acetyltransferase